MATVVRPGQTPLMLGSSTRFNSEGQPSPGDKKFGSNGIVKCAMFVIICLRKDDDYMTKILLTAEKWHRTPCKRNEG